MNSEKFRPLISPELEKALGLCRNIPTIPAVALKIIEASKKPNVTLHEVSEIISSDPAISVKLLSVANSSLYSRHRTLNNLREALTLLGFNASLTIALSFSLLQSLGNSNTIENENYWKRSILSASIAQLLGKHLNVARLEDLFLASLLQDIGIIVLQCIENSPYPTNAGSNLKHIEHIKLEKEKLGIEHPVIGAWLLNSWHLPEYLVNSVLYSHSLINAESDQGREDIYFHYCLNLSGSLADVWLDDNPGDLLLSILDVAKVTLDIDIDDFHQLIVNVDNALLEISNLFEISLVGESEREKVVTEANELLLERSIISIKQSEDDRRYIQNITDRVEQVEKESRIDHLTNIYNRQYIDELLSTEFEEATNNHWPLSLAFIDVDNFKYINDTHGHLIGDEILQLISGFFLNNIRGADILARYGGDEFLLMLPGSSSEVAYSVLKRLLRLFESEAILKVKGRDVAASVSVGLATHMGENEFRDLKSFMSAADDALYKAKEEGKNCLIVYQ